MSYEADYQSSNFSLSNWGDTKSWSKKGLRVSEELGFGHTKPVRIAIVAGYSQKKIINGNTYVEPFILKYVDITCSIQVVHRI